MSGMVPRLGGLPCDEWDIDDEICDQCGCLLDEETFQCVCDCDCGSRDRRRGKFVLRSLSGFYITDGDGGWDYDEFPAHARAFRSADTARKFRDASGQAGWWTIEDRSGNTVEGVRR